MPKLQVTSGPALVTDPEPSGDPLYDRLVAAVDALEAQRPRPRPRPALTTIQGGDDA